MNGSEGLRDGVRQQAQNRNGPSSWGIEKIAYTAYFLKLMQIGYQNTARRLIRTSIMRHYAHGYRYQLAFFTCCRNSPT